MIILAAADLDAIAAAAEAAYPHECCGLLAGRTAAPDALRVTRVVPSRNVAEQRRHDRFEVDPQVRFDLMRALAGSDERLIGHYHSHPDHPAVPSATDRAMAHEPDLIWLITAVAAGRATATRAWRPVCEDCGFREIPIRLDPDTRL